MSSKPIISIHVDETELGPRWTLMVLGNRLKAGHAKTTWAALDAANDELYNQFFTPAGRYYQSELAKRQNDG
jgi:hypothetical protein